MDKFIFESPLNNKFPHLEKSSKHSSLQNILKKMDNDLQIQSSKHLYI